ncbi:MAG: LacI family DNA-binding transcriptional regulator [Lachnospiraceae bacterium]|nr:LacI family DNA-binding transcriptional regulator [Lachnospiraceae bacterium]
MVSMKDLAAACNVSIATVSKALNDQKDVSPKTKEMIRQKARELGYYPNSAAKALKTNRSHNIGVLFVDDSQSGLTHDFFAHVLDSFKRTIEQHDYDMTMVNCSTSHSRSMSYLERTKYRGFDGVAIACIDFRDPQVLELVHSKVPVVTIDYIFNDRIAVVSDNVKGMKELLTYVWKMGHRKIAYIHGSDSSVTQARLSSFYTTAAQLGLKIPEAYVREAAYRSTEAACAETRRLLSMPDPPTCILYPDDFACFGGMNAIREMGLRIPEDISIAGYDGISLGRHIEPKLTTIRQDTERIGACAAEQLISLIERPRATIIRPITIEGTLYEGNTVRDMHAHLQ